MTKEDAEFQRLKARIDAMQYYHEKRDTTFRDMMHSMNLGVVPRQNLDVNNLMVLEAELKNLELQKNPTPEQSKRIVDLRAIIAMMRKTGVVGGNPNMEQVPN